MKNKIKKTLPIIFLITFSFLFFTLDNNKAYAAAQCNAVPPYVTVTSEETMPAFTSTYVPWSVAEETYTLVGVFPSYSACIAFCPGFPTGGATCSLGIPSICSSSYQKIYTFKHFPPTTYNLSQQYCAAGLPPSPTVPDQYCVPTIAGCAPGFSTYVGSNDLGGGTCERVYSCTRRIFTGDYRYINATNCSAVPGAQPGCTIQSGTFGSCTFYKDVNSYYTEQYYCGVTQNPPSNVDVDATIWTSSARSTIFSSQNGDGPLWAYSQAPYRISWGPVTGATSCSLNGSPVSISGGSINTYTIPLNTNSLTYTLSCTGSGGTTEDSVTIYVPPKPTSGVGSCPNPGTTGSFSWTAPNVNVGGISIWNTFITTVINTTTSTQLGYPATDSNFVGTSKNFTTTVNNSYLWSVSSKHNTTGAFSDPVSGSFTCSNSCINLTLNSSKSGFSLTNSTTNPTPGLTQNLTVSPGQVFYSYVDYGNSSVGYIITPNVSGSYGFDNWLGWNSGTAGRFGYSNINFAPSTPGTYTYTTGISSNPTYCSSGPTPIGTVTVSVPATCNPSIIGTNQMYGCSYSGTNFNTLTGSSLTGPTLSSPVSASASPLPNTNWGTGGPNSLVDNFSVRWKGRFNFNAGTYTFTTASDDGSRAYFDDNNDGLPDNGYIVNDWSNHAIRSTSGSPVYVSAGQHTVVYEMYEATGGAGYGLSWTATLVPTVSINANDTNLPNPNSGTNINWYYSGASSCSFDFPASSPTYPNGSGSYSTGSLSASRTYTICCNSVCRSVTVNVAPQTFGLTVNKSGQGSIVSSPSGISCGVGCNSQSANFTAGTNVSLTATPSSGRIFTGWSGGTCSGLSTTCSFVMPSTPVTVNANFAVDPNYIEF